MIEDVFVGIEYFLKFSIHNLPAEERQINALLSIAEQLKEEPEHAVQLVLTNHDDPREIHFAWQNEGYKMILVFPMEDFDWPNPLLLCGEKLAFDDVQEILCGICLEGRETDSFSVIMNSFRNITSSVFGKPAPDTSRDHTENSNDYTGENMIEASNAKMTDEQLLERLAGYAEPVLNAFLAKFKKPSGIDMRQALVFSAAFAGHACHRAAKKRKESYAVVTTEDGKNFYFGDDVNRYLLEDRLSVVNFILAASEISKEDVLSIVAEFSSMIGSEDLSVCEYEPQSLYEAVSQCWEGIFDDMTSKYCDSPAEWPILFGIVLHTILQMAIGAGEPKGEMGKRAVACAVALSKMDKDSF